jgi:hypothetical protein
MDQILVGMDNEVVKEATKIFKKQGFTFTLNTMVKGAQVMGNQVHVDMESKDGTKKETKIFDKVLISIGRRPYTQNLFGSVTFLFSMSFVDFFLKFGQNQPKLKSEAWKFAKTPKKKIQLGENVPSSNQQKFSIFEKKVGQLLEVA